MTGTVRINLTDEQGTFLGQLTFTADELRAMRESPMAAQTFVSDVCVEAGIR